jgi:hypothetical protein
MTNVFTVFCKRSHFCCELGDNVAQYVSSPITEAPSASKGITVRALGHRNAHLPNSVLWTVSWTYIFRICSLYLLEHIFL